MGNSLTRVLLSLTAVIDLAQHPRQRLEVRLGPHSRHRCQTVDERESRHDRKLHPGNQDLRLRLVLSDAAEQARCIRFLASDDASYMVGAVLSADGGSTAH